MEILRNLVQEEIGKKPIVYDIYYKKSQAAEMPVVLFCHGYKGFKDWGAWDLVAKAFAEAGIFFVKFNFSHNGGTVEQPIDFPDLEAFSENNYSIELDDVSRMITTITKFEDMKLDSLNLNIIGHSRGGGLAFLASEKYNAISKCITWAAVSDFAVRFQEGTPAFDQWKETGMSYVENARTKQMLPHKYSFYEDFDKNREAYTIKRAISESDKPKLVIHGTADKSVVYDEALALEKWGANTQLYTIEGADHVFQTKHPWTETFLPTEMERVIKISLDFITS